MIGLLVVISQILHPVALRKSFLIKAHAYEENNKYGE